MLTMRSEEDQEHSHEYAHSASPYVANQNSYSYNPNTTPGAQGVTSPHHNGSDRMASRAAPSQTLYQSGYPAPQRSNTAPASNVYNVVEPRDAANVPSDTHYYSPANGAGTKRGREDEDDVDEMSKRQRNDPEDGGPVGGSPYTAINSGRPTIPARKAR